MKQATDAFGREIKPGQFIIYAAANGHMLRVEPGLVVRVSEKRISYSQKTESVVSVLIRNDGRVSLRVMRGISCVQPESLPKDVVDELLLAYETRYGLPIMSIDMSVRGGRDGELFIGVD